MKYLAEFSEDLVREQLGVSDNVLIYGARIQGDRLVLETFVRIEVDDE